ncbi:Retroviral aspartyl protease [Popillia japonica]|uniref:Retroviral aspartyl protease n=1 Tax=Popillia japonica TaxID=7064 RepID=A0AAW1HGC5_POPJA
MSKTGLFSCNKFGHISKDCNKQREQNRTTRQNDGGNRTCIVHEGEKEPQGHITLTLNGHLFYGFVDTGSEINLLKASSYIQMGAPMFSGNPITIRGLGNVETRTLGKFMAHVTIDSHQFSTDVHVVSDEAIPTKLIVGKPILEQVTLTISSEGIQVTAPTIFDVKDGLEKLKIVLRTAEENGLEIKWKKCQFLKDNVTYLGHEIENGTVTPSRKKIEAVADFPEPTTLKKVQIIEKEYANLFMEEREELRKIAKQQMAIVQTENIATFNKKRKTATKYKVGDLVAIRRIQFRSLSKDLCQCRDIFKTLYEVLNKFLLNKRFCVMDPKEEAKLLQWYDEVETGSECDPFSDDEQDEGDELGNEQEELLPDEDNNILESENQDDDDENEEWEDTEKEIPNFKFDEVQSGIKIDIQNVSNIEIYQGKADNNDAITSKTESLVLRLLEPYLDKGHHIYMDNFYNSVSLSSKLISRKTHSTGTGVTWTSIAV